LIAVYDPRLKIKERKHRLLVVQLSGMTVVGQYQDPCGDQLLVEGSSPVQLIARFAARSDAFDLEKAPLLIGD
jgi:hypothetical protein